jgi:DNA polymerase-3 subunit delta'
MNINANNSLLKLLEEPQDDTVLVLVTSKPDQLPITIRSRCQQISLIPPSFDELKQWVLTQINVDSNTLKSVAKLANLAPLLTLRYLEEGTLEKLKALDSDFEALLLSTANPVTMAKRWLDYDLQQLCVYLQQLVKDKLLVIASDQHSEKQRHYWHIYDCILATMKLLSSPNNMNKTLVIEQFLVSVMQHQHNNNAAISR